MRKMEKLLPLLRHKAVTGPADGPGQGPVCSRHPRMPGLPEPVPGAAWRMEITQQRCGERRGEG